MATYYYRNPSPPLNTNAAEADSDERQSGAEFDLLAALPAGFDTGAMHTYGLDWSASTIVYYVDGKKIRTEPAKCLDSEMTLILSIETAYGSAAPADNFDEAATIAYFRHYTNSNPVVPKAPKFAVGFTIPGFDLKTADTKSTTSVKNGVADAVVAFSGGAAKRSDVDSVELTQGR